MKKYLVKLLVFSLFITCFIYRSQEVKASDQIDSLKLLIKNQTDGIEKADNLLNLAKSYYDIYMMDSAESCIQKTILLSKKLNYPQGEAEAFYRLSLIKFRTGNYNAAKNNILIFLNISDSLKDSMKLAKGYWLYGTLKRETGENPAAISNYKASLLIFGLVNDSSRMLSVFQSLGNLFLNLSEFDSAAYYYHKTIVFCEAIGNEKGLASALNQLGKTYSLLPHPQYDEARKFLFKSLEINKKYNKLHGIALNYANIANIASKLDELDSALYYYEKIEVLNIQIGNTVGLIHNYNNIAEVYEKQGKYSNALQNYEKALSYYQEQSMDGGIIVSLQNIADIYVDFEKYSLAHIYYDSSLNLAIKGGYKNYQINILTNKSIAYYSEENYKKAFDCQKKYYDLADSIFSLKTAEIIADLKLKYEKKKDQARILILENENLAKDLSLRKRTNQRNIYLFSGSSLILIILFLFIFYRNKSRKDRIIADQKIKQLEEEKKLLAARFLVEGQEEERKRIAKDLHDGLGVLLSTAKMHFTSIQDKIPGNKPLLEKAAKLLEQASGDVRKISHNMMPGLLTRFGLFEAVEDLIDQVDEKKGINAKYEISGDTKRLPENTEIMLYRIIQEMVNNTLKHAEAKNISLVIKIQKDHLNIKYFDDGKGFNVGEKLQLKSIGLNSIQSRVNFLSGNITMQSEPGQGVNHAIHIPIV